jgi:lipopolysaccharide/colanic/teichoic acid biosynthesis glycosyltransferase/NDP-sugar pyrophosphorylase family protein
MKAVIFVNGNDGELRPLTNGHPKYMLPVVNRPFLEYTLRVLRKSQIEDVILCLNEESRRIAEYFRDGSQWGVRIKYFSDAYRNGTGGCLKNLADELSDEPFYAIDGSLFIDGDISSLLAFHQDGLHLATMGVAPRFAGMVSPVLMDLSPDQTIRTLSHAYGSDEGPATLTYCGISVFDPGILKLIPQNRYFDLKEQLVPDLARNGRGTRIFEFQGYWRKLERFEDFFAINRYVLFQQKMDKNPLHNSRGEGIWTEDGADISSEAQLLGPLVVGKGAVIEKNVRIIGPTAIGEGCRISEGSLVFDSVFLPRVSLARWSRVESCVMGRGTTIPQSFNCAQAVVTGDPIQQAEYNLISRDIKLRYLFLSRPSLYMRRLQHNLYLKVKSFSDFLGSLVGLVLCAPLFLLISVAIKLDSKGPIFFRQSRCGKEGKEFCLYKFRSMIENAEGMQGELLKQNESDGPMFKVSRDPRLTRVGRLLRKFSLDEIPQLINILKGEMSFVGPRPLEMKEMRFDPAWRDIRLKVKPRITGLWQIHGRYEGNFRHWVRHDTNYVKNRSLWLDIRILVKTIKVIIAP